MIRLIVLGTGFLGITAGLLWFGLAPLDEPAIDFNEVSRSEPDLLGLKPALPQPIKTPVAAASATIEQAAAASPSPKPASVEASVTVAPAPSGQNVDAMEALRAMSYGNMKELQAPTPTTEATRQASLAPAIAPMTAPVAPAPQPAGQSYTVKTGDSLPGIAFRFYGTTVAYLQILDANPDQLTDPSDLRAGMTLTIPNTN